MKKKKEQKNSIPERIERQWGSYVAKVYTAHGVKLNASEYQHLHAAFLAGTCVGSTIVADAAQQQMIGIGVYAVIHAFEPKGKKK